MIKEIYIRDAEDPNYDPTVIDFTDEVESLITQIRMIIGTSQNEVFGSPGFGFELEDYIFRTKFGASDIKEKLQEQFDTYLRYSDNLDLNIDIKFGDSGKGWDYAILDIYINGRKTLGFLIDKEDNE